jgi:peptidoglycan/xylan/chitin deacetylase (PgdA/CDA1 family)
MAFEPARWMKERTKQALAPLARLATRNYARVLMYHRFGPGDPRKLSADSLDEQLRFLRRHFNVVPLNVIVSRLRSGAAPEPSSVALTVDDAYADFGEHAYPVFRKHGIPVTIYVVSEFANGGLWLWWDAIRHLLNQAAAGFYRPVVSDRLIDISLTDAASRQQAWLTLAGIGVRFSPTERDQYLQDLQAAFSLALPASPPREFAALNWDELRSLDPDIVEIGAHTRTHPILSRCDSQRIVDEVSGSKTAIEAQLGRQVSAFCYPNGDWSDVDDRCIRAVRDAGFDSAVMACGAMIGKGANPYALERMSAPHARSDFESDVSGISFLRRRVGHDSEPSF